MPVDPPLTTHSMMTHDSNRIPRRPSRRAGRCIRLPKPIRPPRRAIPAEQLTMTITITSDAFQSGRSDSEAIHRRRRRPFAAAGLDRRAAGGERIGPDLRRSRCSVGQAVGPLGDLQHSRRHEIARRRNSSASQSAVARRRGARNQFVSAKTTSATAARRRRKASRTITISISTP